MTDEIENNIDAAISAGVALAQAEGRIYEKNGVFMSWDNDEQRFIEIREIRDKPGAQDKNGEAFNSLSSFMGAVELQRTASSAVFFNRDRVRCILDRFGPLGPPDFGFGFKFLIHEFHYSKELNDWRYLANNGLVRQDSFTEFLEDHLEDILTPNGSQLLAICSDLEVTSESYFSRSKRLQDGTVCLTYNETQEANSKADSTLTLPKELVIAVPFYAPSMSEPMPELVEFKIRLSYRLRDGDLSFRIKIMGLDKIELEANRRVYDRISKELAPLNVPLFEG